MNNKYLLEPVGRNTARAIVLACMALDRDDMVLVTPSDHLIKDENEYAKVLSQAKELVEENNLVTFGITPTFPETGFGYIEAENFNVKAFHEKPNFETATKYVEAGNYYWNSGMFMFKAGVFLEELKKYSPEMYKRCVNAIGNDALASSKGEVKTSLPNMIRIKYEDMIKIPEESIDYAVMEKSDKVKVVPSNIGWSDVGSFDALYEELPKDENNNTKNDKYIQVDSKNNLIYGHDRHIATVRRYDNSRYRRCPVNI